MAADSRKIIIIAAPSGSGKTSITRFLLHKYPALCLSVSAATRKPRGEEKDGVHYHFISEDEFKHKIEENAFVEWEMVYEGSYYGTLKAELERIWSLGRTPILDIDVKGAIHLQDQFPNRCLSIFIEPPSVEELEKRLRLRGTDKDQVIAERVENAKRELARKKDYDFLIMNDDVDDAYRSLKNAIERILK